MNKPKGDSILLAVFLVSDSHESDTCGTSTYGASGSIRTKAALDSYRTNYDNIFGKKNLQVN